MESFIDNPNLFCIQFIDGNYCICRSRGDNSAKIGCCFICENHSEYSDYIIQAQIKYRIYVNSKMES